MPTGQVLAFFDLSATGGEFLTLDSTEPKGELDDAAAILAGDIATDITDDVARVSIRRGRESQLLGDIPAGRWTVQLRNEDRDYDPLHSASPYYGNIVPGKRVKVIACDVVIADGAIEDWGFEFLAGGSSTAFIDCADGLANLAAAEFGEWTATASQTTGARIAAVLDRPEVTWTENRELDTGVSTLQGDTVAWGTNVLAYLSTVAASDLGTLYASRLGVVTFLDRHHALNATPALCFADDGTGLPFTALEVSYGAEKLFNRVGIERAGGTAQTADDAASQAAYRPRSFTASGLLLEDDDQALDMANYLVGIYAEPELRISSLTTELAVLAADEQRQVLELDIASLVCITFTPNDVGDPIDRTCIVEGISHEMAPGSHVVTLSLGDVDRRSTVRLDDSVFGRLDFNVLAF